MRKIFKMNGYLKSLFTFFNSENTLEQKVF